MNDIIISGEQSVSLDGDEQEIMILGKNCTLAHRGKTCMIKNVDYTSDTHGENSVIMCSGSRAQITYAGKLTAFTAGADAHLAVGFGSDDNNPIISDGAKYFAAGDETGAFVYEGVKNSLIVMSGDRASIEDTVTTDAAFPRDERNTIILTGKNSDVRTGYPGDTLVVMGNETEVEMERDRYEEAPGVQGGLAFIGGKDCRVMTGTDSAFYCAYTPAEISFEKNSMTVIGWHDGTRERASTFYEGENGVEAGVKYTMNSLGQLVKI
ncbi:hypothetical protein [Morganella morganii]|uniref:hypothetical protein n=1 Tax=Morganella morganii TaxID=582 RepID=UPI001BDA5766|nr:hypothetical protein [Morganella morganii]MBT0383003.1 hypothetical protein [Morganella morganii subsp. morganii]